jgi:hypothetical protein
MALGDALLFEQQTCFLAKVALVLLSLLQRCSVAVPK